MGALMVVLVVLLVFAVASVAISACALLQISEDLRYMRMREDSTVKPPMKTGTVLIVSYCFVLVGIVALCFVAHGAGLL